MADISEVRNINRAALPKMPQGHGGRVGDRPRGPTSSRRLLAVEVPVV